MQVCECEFTGGICANLVELLIGKVISTCYLPSMRKLKLQMQMPVDGFVSTGPNDEQKWVTWALEDIYQYVLDLLNSIDTIIIGRNWRLITSLTGRM